MLPYFDGETAVNFFWEINCIRVTLLEDFLTLKWPGSFIAPHPANWHILADLWHLLDFVQLTGCEWRVVLFCVHCIWKMLKFHSLWFTLHGLQMSDYNSEIDTVKYVYVVVKMWLMQSMWPKEVCTPLFYIKWTMFEAWLTARDNGPHPVLGGTLYTHCC